MSDLPRIGGVAQIPSRQGMGEERSSPMARAGLTTISDRIVINPESPPVTIAEVTGPARAIEATGSEVQATMTLWVYSFNGYREILLQVIPGPIPAGLWFRRTGDLVQGYRIRCSVTGAERPVIAPQSRITWAS